MQVEQVRPFQRQHWLKIHCCACSYCSSRYIGESHRLEMQVPDAEFFAVEQALLAAGRQLAAKPKHTTGPAAVTRKLPASVTSNRKPSAVQQTGQIVDCKKRKLPTSFAQQEQNERTQAVQAGLQYKVHVSQKHGTLPLLVLCNFHEGATQRSPFHAGTHHLCIHRHGS